MSLTTSAPIGVIAADYVRQFTARRRATRSGSLHRTGAPVRRDSLEAGTFEDGFFVVPARGETDRMLMIARAALDEARRLRRKARAGVHLTVRERSIAALTPAAIRLYEEICQLARVCAGKVYPSYEHFVEKLAFGRRTVARVLPLLENAGLLIRQRRFEKVHGDGAGRRYRQTSNAYRPLLAEKLLSLLPRWARPATDDRQTDIEDAIASSRSGGEPDAAPLPDPDAPVPVRTSVSAPRAAQSRQSARGREAGAHP